MRTLYFYEDPMFLDVSRLIVRGNDKIIEIAYLDRMNLNAKDLVKFIMDRPECEVYISSKYPYLLKNELFWNYKLNEPEIYFYKNNKKYKISSLTDKEIRFPHNLEKMWWNGAFDVE